MKTKVIIPLAVAVVLGLFAARIAMTLVANAPHEVVQAVPTTTVVVADRDIEPGTTLADTDLHPVQLNADLVPPGTFATKDGLSGRVTKIALVPGQVITPNLLADDGSGYGVSATLPEGMRAITVEISDTTGVAGFILPKCRVDVLATLTVEGKSIAKTLLEGVQVIAVGSRTNPNTPPDQNGQPQPPSRTVTLMVKPKDVEKVELAATTSRIRLVLRNGRDESVADSDGITLADLKGGKETDPFADAEIKTVAATQPAPVEPVKRSWTVTMIKAGAVTQQTFDVPAPTTKPADADPFDGVITNIDPQFHN